MRNQRKLARLLLYNNELWICFSENNHVNITINRSYIGLISVLYLKYAQKPTLQFYLSHQAHVKTKTLVSLRLVNIKSLFYLSIYVIFLYTPQYNPSNFHDLTRDCSIIGLDKKTFCLCRHGIAWRLIIKIHHHNMLCMFILSCIWNLRE